jgi:hypothetical protein
MIIKYRHLALRVWNEWKDRFLEPSALGAYPNLGVVAGSTLRAGASTVRPIFISGHGWKRWVLIRRRVICATIEAT